jgi:hypothetical protein
MDDLRTRIANLEVQRDALASALCDKAKHADEWAKEAAYWQSRFREAAKITKMVEHERDQAIRRAEIAEAEFEHGLEEDLEVILDDDNDDAEDRPCVKCGRTPSFWCSCFDRYPDISKHFPR